MVGREKEIELLSKIYSSDKPELLAVFGRRRVGSKGTVETRWYRHVYHTGYWYSDTALQGLS
jgi:AAA+ ATPase superfamily predicted ATPase